MAVHHTQRPRQHGQLRHLVRVVHTPMVVCYLSLWQVCCNGAMGNAQGQTNVAQGKFDGIHGAEFIGLCQQCQGSL